MLCSFHFYIDEDMQKVLSTAMESYNFVKHNLQGRKPKFIEPHSHKQPNDYECGYYVMRHMFNIISKGIINSWTKGFSDETPFSREDINDI
ncbi:unnamed protein product [Lathyrus oleraceus]